MKNIAKTVSAAVCGLILLWTVACNDNGVGPQPGSAEYLVYFYSEGDHSGGVSDDTPQFFSYNPYSNVVDSFILPLNPKNDLGISPDGRLLYVPTASTVAVVEAHSHEILDWLPYPNVVGIATPKRGRLIALYGDGLWILNADTHQPIYHDTNSVLSGSFSDFGDRFYYARGEAGAYMLTLGRPTEESHVQIRTPNGYMPVTQVAGVEDSAMWVLYSMFTSNVYYLITYDTTIGWLHGVDKMEPGGGEFTMTSDERLVFYNNPGSQNVHYDDPPEIGVLNMQTRRIEKFISTVRYEGSAPTDTLRTHDLCVTPDGKWLVATSRYGKDTIVLINIETLKIERFVDLGGHPYLYGTVCQGKE